MIQLEHIAQVWGIIGLLGGGKTLTAVSIIIDNLDVGNYIITNIVLNDAELTKRYGGEEWRKLVEYVDVETADPHEWISGSPRGSGGCKRVLVVLDEVAEWFNQYKSGQDFKVQRFFSWLRHSSKRGQDVFFIIQDEKFLTKSIRSLVNQWLVAADLQVVKVPAIRMRLPPFFWPYCWIRIFDRNGKLTSTANFVKKKYYGKFYDTAQLLSGAGIVTFETVNIRRVLFFPRLLFIGLLIYFTFFD